ncbi:MAG TPA: hypothetical protein VIG44_08130 [Thermomicrobiales bacterium]|jgi:hypothetical protein
MTKQTKADVAATVDHLIALAGLTVTPEEHDYFVRAYPVLRASLQYLRIPEARDAEPALIYPADNRR